jgi:hypothetical protein
MTQLIRHTIEHIKVRRYARVLNADRETFNAVNQIIQNTPGYTKGNREKVLHDNKKPFIIPTLPSTNHSKISVKEFFGAKASTLAKTKRQSLWYYFRRSLVMGGIFEYDIKRYGF